MVAKKFLVPIIAIFSMTAIAQTETTVPEKRLRLKPEEPVQVVPSVTPKKEKVVREISAEAVAPVPAAAPAVPKAATPPLSERVTLKGTFRLRSEAADQTDFASKRDVNLIRVRTGLEFKASDEVNIFFQPQFSKAFGEPVYISNNALTNTTQQTSGTTYDPGMLVHQAYMGYRPNGSYEVLAGRQVLDFGDALVIGGLDWHNVSRSFDAIRVNIKGEKMNNTLFASKVMDMNTISTSTTVAKSHGDRNLFGSYNTFNVSESLKTLDIYLLYQTDHTQQPLTYQTLGTDLYVFGTRAVSKIGNFDYRFEATGQEGSGGDQRIKKAYQADLELGYTLADNSIKPRFAVEAFGSGQNYDQLYPTVHKWLGIADVLGRRNVTGYAAHFSQQWSEAFSTVLDYHYFDRTNTSTTAFKLNGTTALGATTTPGKKLGDELDLTFKYKVSSIMTLSGGGGYFWSGNYLREQFSGKNPLFSYLQVETTF